jgi:hypothetical protein
VAAGALVAAVAVARCGGRSTSPPAATTSNAGAWSAATCRRQAQVIDDDARQILLDYGAQSAYPADLAYYMFRHALVEFERHSCTPQLLGSTLARRLTHKQVTDLLSHLPDESLPRTPPPTSGC